MSVEGHSHCHGHGHSHGVQNFNSAFIIGIGLNVAYVLLEGLAGWKYNSLALLSDAGHNLGDVGTLLLAWFAISISKRKSSYRHTYGFGKATILAALINGILLMMAIGALLYESLWRLFEGVPESVNSVSVMVVATIGIVINGVTALLFMKDQKGDLNIRGAFLHMVADALVSAGVVIAGAVILFTGVEWIDPLTSIAICLVIGISSWGLLKSSLHLTMNGVPDGIDVNEVAEYLSQQPSVKNVHDLHIWALSTSQIALTVHIVQDITRIDDQFLDRISHELKDRFNISHPTIQIENTSMHANDLLCGCDES